MRRTTLGPARNSVSSGKRLPNQIDNVSTSHGCSNLIARPPKTATESFVSQRATSTQLAQSESFTSQKAISSKNKVLPHGPKSFRRSTISSGRPRSRIDPRPLTDRQYIQKSARDLTSFLMARGYDQPLSTKALTAPSTRDFQNIFLFLLREIDPYFSFQNEMEEEVSIVLRCLGYPFSLSKSALSAVGSPHTWPNLLGTLTWISGLLTYIDARRKDEEAAKQSNPLAMRENFFHENMVQAYFRFLQGEDTFQDLDDKLIHYFETEKTAREGEIKLVESDCRELETTLHTLHTQPSPIQLIKEHQFALETNIEKYSQLIGMLFDHEAKVAENLKIIEKDIIEEETKLRLKIEEKKRLLQLFRDQKEIGIDAKEIVSGKILLENSMRIVNEQLRLATLHCSNQHVQLHSRMSHFENGMRRYEGLIALLNLPSSLEGLAEKSILTISVSEDILTTAPEHILSKDVNKDIIPAIEKLRSGISNHVMVLQDELLSLEDEKDQLEEVLIVTRTNESLLQARAQNLELQYKQSRCNLAAKLKEHSAIVLKKEDKMKQLHQAAEVRFEEAQNSLERNLQALKRCRERFSRLRKRLTEIAGEYVDRSEKHHIDVIDSLSLITNNFSAEDASC